MTYEELKELCKDFGDKDFPLSGKNEYGQNVRVTKGYCEGETYYSTTTTQDNGWFRTNVYWEDGTTEELYEK